MPLAMPQEPSCGAEEAVGGASTGSVIIGDVAAVDAAALIGAAQLTVKPPLMPLQSQRQGPSPVTSVGAPATHKSVAGLLPLARPLAGPQLASTLTDEAVSPAVGAGSSMLGTATCAICIGFSGGVGDCVAGITSAADAVTIGAGAAGSAAGIEDGGMASLRTAPFVA